MQGHKQFTDKVVLRFRLSERVPRHNLYRQLAELLDWGFLYEQTQALYSQTGQPSLDPVVFFKLVLVGRLEKVVIDRRLVEHCALLLDIRYFLGYDVDEDLPGHSTISRMRQLYPAAVFEHLFDHVFAQAWPRASWRARHTPSTRRPSKSMPRSKVCAPSSQHPHCGSWTTPRR
jgi:transposase